MGRMNLNLEEAFRDRKFKICERCGKQVRYQGGGVYECTACGHIVLDDLGKVKDYIEKNGPASVATISAAIGVQPEVVVYLLKSGRIEIPEGSEVYVKCEKCGCDIRYGRYCQDCIKTMAGGLEAMFMTEAGEKPKREFDGEKRKLHYFGKRKE